MAARDVDITKPHPTRPGWFHIEMIGRLTNLTTRRLQQLVKDGVIPKGEGGYYPLLETISAYCSHMQRQLAGRPPTDRGKEASQLMEERRRKIRLENDRMEGRLYTADLVERVFSETIVVLASSLDGVAGRIAGGDAILRQRLLNEHRRVREIFSEKLTKFADELAGGLDAPASSEADQATAE